MEKIIKEKLEKLNDLKINTLNDLEAVRIEYLGKKGIIPNMMSDLKDAAEDKRKELGKLINDFKNQVTGFVDEKNQELKELILQEQLNSESIDVTIPGIDFELGKVHILENIIEELEELFISLGFDVLEGPEIETDLFNFEMLNLPKGHPARDAQDTFYITSDTLLRSQTSPAQIRSMLANEEKTPMRMICSGKTYRRDNDDATHSHQFTQMEGLVVDKNISLSDLKGALELMATRLFGDVSSRFRPSFYPFTEPSVEFDISCFACKGKGCPICKGTGWITVAGAGMVHPKVLENCGYDSTKVTGYAFGLGIERLAMVKYGINDIRVFYTNDLRIKGMDIREVDNNEN